MVPKNIVINFMENNVSIFLNSIFKHPISESDVIQMIKTMKYAALSGFDQVSNNQLKKICSQVIVPAASHH